MTGRIITYENNNSALSCRGEVELSYGAVKSKYFKGKPRSGGRDRWFSFYRDCELGNYVTEVTVEWLLSFNGCDNIISIKEDL
jgi:hypothetical protein